ncbi:hypothetical protein GQ53DRAFT_647011, partial [Thozetella sp. PMI_491]
NRLAVEDFPAGYPRFAALVSSHRSFHVFRRFMRLRARLLLQKQDRLSLLESQLDEIDRNEPRPLFLGNIRRDSNRAREDLLNQINVAISDYDSFLDSCEGMMARPLAKSRDVTSLRNWVENTSSLARDETTYLSEKDLFGLGVAGMDKTDHTLQDSLEGALIWCKRVSKLVSCGINLMDAARSGQQANELTDPTVHFFSPRLLKALSRFLLGLILLVILLAPVTLLIILESLEARVFVVLIFCVLFVAILMTLVKIRTGETFVAGAA